MKKYINLIVLFILGFFIWISPQAAVAQTTPRAGQFDCSADIFFGISPKSISTRNSVVISGTVKATTVIPNGYVNGGYCQYPKGGNFPPFISEYLVSIYDKVSSRELFYISGFNLEYGSGKTQYQWSLPSRNIGMSELASSGLSSAKNLKVVAQVKVYNANTGSYYQLRESAPVDITVSSVGEENNAGKTCTGGPEKQGTCDVGYICSAATGGTCAAAKTGNETKNTNNTSLPTDKLYNPLPEEDLTHMFLIIVQGFLAIIGIWAVMFIIVGGFQMVMAAGNEEAILKAKKTITWAVIGMVIALLSFSIIAIVQNILQTSIK